MRCWKLSIFNAQGSRVIIVVVQVGAVKLYVAAVEALRRNERQDETQFSTKNCAKTRPVYDQTLGSGSVFSLPFG